MSTQEMRRRIRALIHPGMTDVINGRTVKREAMRFVIDSSTYAYDVDSAVEAIAPTPKRIPE